LVRVGSGALLLVLASLEAIFLEEVMPIFEANIEVVCDVCDSQEYIEMEIGYDDYSGSGAHPSLPLTIAKMEAEGWVICEDEDEVICPFCTDENKEE